MSACAPEELAMRVRELMTSPATTCNPQDSLEHAAHLLWEHDCGALAVIDAKGAVQALLTDRDICMAAYTKGLRLADIAVRDSMSQDLAVCRDGDDVATATATMRARSVRRPTSWDESRAVDR